MSKKLSETIPTISYQQKEFSMLRRLFWPIHGFEVKKFLPIAIMMFCVLFNYTILRNSKDALTITAAGPEVVPFLKGWLIMPVSILFVTLYAKLSNVLSRQNLFYFSISIFVIFFLSFALYIYPNQDMLQPNPEYIKNLKLQYPNFQHLISLWQCWTFGAFYMFSELWGAVALGLLFWQFANEVTTTKEAKRFYTMFAFLGHFALILAGLTVKDSCSADAISGSGSCSGYINSIIMYFSISTAVIVAVYWWLNRYVLTDPRYYSKAGVPVSKKKKPKLSLWESFSHIFQSKYLGCIFLLVLGYGLSQNLVGYLWKRQIQLQYPDALDYAYFMGDFSILTGIITILLIFVSKNLVYRFGWFRGAIATPMVLLITISIFLSLIYFDSFFFPLAAIFGVTPLFMSVWTGTGQQMLSKAAKYSLFDPTKEMSYIPLSDDLKVKGKAAIDVTGHQFSKASGGYVASFLLIVTAADNFSSLMPYFSVIIFLTIGVWFLAVRSLNKQYHVAVKKAGQEE